MSRRNGLRPRGAGSVLARPRRRNAAALVSAIAAAPLLWPASAHAVNYVWTNAGANNTFGNAGNWAPIGVPDDTTDAAIFDGSQPGSDTFTVNFFASTLNDRLHVNLANPGGTGTFNLNGLTYTVDGGGAILPSILVGQGSGASSGWAVTNGTVNAADATIGDGAGSSGGVQVLAGATLNLTRFSRIGSSGSGAMRIADGGDVTSTVRNTWLEITLRPTLRNGLAVADVFQFGNLIAETGDAAGPARVGADDYIATRAGLETGTVAITDPRDHDRDRRVNARDLVIVRSNLGHALAPPSSPVIEATSFRDAIRPPSRSFWRAAGLFPSPLYSGKREG